VSAVRKNLVFCVSNADKSYATVRHKDPGVVSKVISGLNYGCFCYNIGLCRRWMAVTCGGSGGLSAIFFAKWPAFTLTDGTSVPTRTWPSRMLAMTTDCLTDVFWDSFLGHNTHPHS